MIKLRKSGKLVSLGGKRYQFSVATPGGDVTGEVFPNRFNWEAYIPYDGRKFCVISETRIGAVRAVITSVQCAVNRGVV